MRKSKYTVKMLVNAISMNVMGKTWKEIGKFYGTTGSAIWNAVDRMMRSVK
jgi:hypothetical protein